MSRFHARRIPGQRAKRRVIGPALLPLLLLAGFGAGTVLAADTLPGVHAARPAQAKAAASPQPAAVAVPQLAAACSSPCLTVVVSPSYAGHVTSNVGAIDCPSTCQDTYAPTPNGPQPVTIHASPTAGFAFARWEGDCAQFQASDCRLLMDKDRTATAVFGGVDDTFTEVSSSPNPSQLAESVTVTGRECDRTRTVHPTGTITFTDVTTGAQLGSGTLGSVASPSSNCSDTSIAVSTLSAGSHSIQATYEPGGQVPVPASTSAPYTHVVSSPPTTTPTSSTTQTDTQPGMPAGVPAIGEAGQPPLPAVLRPPEASISLNIVGNGTAYTVPSRITSAGSGGAPKLVCGVRGYACYASFPRGTTLTLKEAPARGFRFAGWSGACSGSAATCDVAPSDLRTVSARFSAAGQGASVAVGVVKPRFRVTWSESIGRGKLLVRGRISRAARLRIQLRRPAGGPLISRLVAVPGGAFGQEIKLVPGRLARGAQLFPGGFVVSLTGSSGGIPLPLQVRTITLRAPPAGVVRRAYASTSDAGPAVLTLPASATEAWANFVFEVQPAARNAALTVRWYWPDGRLLGAISKYNRPTIVSFLRSPSGLPRGGWRAELSVGRTVVKRLLVRVG